MEFVEEEQGPQVIRTGDIRHPDDRGTAVWVVRPDESIGKIHLARNTAGGVLEIRDGKVVLTGTARAKGWRYLHTVHGDDAPKRMNDWESKLRANVKADPPDFYAAAQAKSKIDDGEPPEGARRALARQQAAEEAAKLRVASERARGGAA